MKQDKEAAIIAAMVIGMLALVAFIAWWNVSLWSECRETNSFWYCVRVIGR